MVLKQKKSNQQHGLGMKSSKCQERPRWLWISWCSPEPSPKQYGGAHDFAVLLKEEVRSSTKALMKEKYPEDEVFIAKILM